MSTRREVLERVLHGIGFINNILLIPQFTTIILDLSQETHLVNTGYDVENLAFCGFFLLEWVLGLIIAEHRWAYLRSPVKLLDLISALPLSYAFQGLRMARVVRIVRISRVAWRARRYRGRATQLIRALGYTSAIVLAGALGLQSVEPETVPTLTDAAWWAFVTLTTVGYGDIAPVTSLGRLVAAGVMFAGVGVFGYIAGFMTSLFSDPEEDEILVGVRRLEKKVDTLNAILLKMSRWESPTAVGPSITPSITEEYP